MQSIAVEPFSDNWSYLRAELNWLDRLLSLAVAKQRQETRQVDRLAKSRADRVTSHWWKGLINLEEKISYDSPANMPRRHAGPKTSYQQQLEARIEATLTRGIALGLPTLCAQLNLSWFEKNLLLMGLAPEINRRYGHIYTYLHNGEGAETNGLPTVDLVLRLLCRNDREWRTGRLCLSQRSPLLQHQIITVSAPQAVPLLSRSIQIADPVVEYLLAEQPQPEMLADLLQPLTPRPTIAQLPTTASVTPQPTTESLLGCWQPISTHESTIDPWSDLILPPDLMTDLQHLCQRLQYTPVVDQYWSETNLRGHQPPPCAGTIALLFGQTGTGKQTAARAIAQTLQLPLFYACVTGLPPERSQQLLQELIEAQPPLLLLQAAQGWLGRAASLAKEEVQRFLLHRKQYSSLTLFCVEQKQTIRPSWQRQLDLILEFPLPDLSARLALWQRAFPAAVSLDPSINWKHLAKLPLTGGEIRAIARDATLAALADPNQTELAIAITHISRALARKRPDLHRSLHRRR